MSRKVVNYAPNDNVRVKETAKTTTKLTARGLTTTETWSRTVDIKPKPKRKAGPSKPPPAKKSRTSICVRTQSGSNRVSVSTGKSAPRKPPAKKSAANISIRINSGPNRVSISTGNTKQKRKSSPKKPPPSKKSRANISIRTQSDPNRASTSTQISCPWNTSSEVYVSDDSYSDDYEDSYSEGYDDSYPEEHGDSYYDDYDGSYPDDNYDGSYTDDYYR